MLCAMVLVSMIAGDGITSNFIPEGATRRAGGYRPQRSELSATKPGTVKSAPDLKAPRYGSLSAGGQTFGYILDGTKLYIDENGDGAFDEAAVDGSIKNGVSFWEGFVKLQKLGRAKVSFYHFDENDPQRAALKNTMLFYGDYGYELHLTLSKKEYVSVVQGDLSSSGSLWVDRNQDGRQSYNFEMINFGKPFNYTGTTYVITADANGAKLEKAPTKLPIAPMPPNLSVGADSLKFNATTMSGAKINFPSSYKGKVVLLDFWATWCGPCMAEMPNVVDVYNKFHDKGFEILGISFDEPNAEAKIHDVTTKSSMPWEQVYEGKTWETTLGKQFDVSGIPFSVLVDGTTGKILGTSLRGPELGKAVEKALAH